MARSCTENVFKRFSKLLYNDKTRERDRERERERDDIREDLKQYHADLKLEFGSATQKEMETAEMKH